MEDFMPSPEKRKPSAFGADFAKSVHEAMANSQIKKARTGPPPDMYRFDVERYVSHYLANFRISA